ncbi:DUF2975 domain-containing protein [Algimonas porphyrae]|uniref:DUF2975 domain-containing protein n=1 Tax=Algimonas porphyrae TaxID=1128113 RepID=A0ABQ5V0R8_9PROT|nr:DUF2975 domain-containing protein [Algimonas porphyrae]GLQ21046.1 hypothetical protein GCM10007854_20010 [Algimonas porphyrae]
MNALTQTPKPVSSGLIILLRIVQALLLVGLVVLSASALAFALNTGVYDWLQGNSEAGPLPGAGRLAFACITGAITAFAWLAVLSILIRVIRTVQMGDPFVEANITRLRAMWMLIAATEIFRILVHGFADISVGALGVAPADTGMDIRIGTWFLVLVIAALSEAFRQGAEMRAEAELTI